MADTDRTGREEIDRATAGNQSENKPIGLRELIESTVKDLKEARERAGKNPVLTLTSCEMELAVTISANAGAGIKFYIVDVSAKVDWAKVSTIKLTFGPPAGGLPVGSPVS
jgi:hypothetical protein